MKTFLLSCFCLLLSLSLWSKPVNDPVYFRYYSDKLNLPQTTVLQIEQDKRGLAFTGSMVMKLCLCPRLFPVMMKF